MGNDGGSIPDRRDLVRNKPKAEQADKANQTRARWFFCALSKKKLQEPVVSCALGRLYNKDAMIEFLLDRTAFGDGEVICGHIRNLKDVKTLKLTPNSIKTPPSDSTVEVAPFVCPLNFKEMNGVQPFVYLRTCGCVFSQAGLKAVSRTPPPREDAGKLEEEVKEKRRGQEGETGGEKQLDLCPQCGTKFDKAEDIIILNPSPEEEEKLRLLMERRRASEPVKTKGKKRRNGAAAAEGEPPAKKKHGTASPAPSLNPNIAATSRAIVNTLAEEEVNRKANMSAAVRSLYTPKDGVKKKETFMTMGTFTRYA